MKKALLVFCLGINCFVFGQGAIIIPQDSCNFEYPFSTNIELKIDTSSTNIWQIGKPTKAVFNASYSDSLCIVTDTINTYPNSNHSFFDLKIPQFCCFNIIVSFKHKVNSDTLIDGGYIEASYDYGSTWHNVIYDSVFNWNYGEFFQKQNLYTLNDTLKGGIPGFSGTTNDWMETRLQWIFYFPVRSNIPDTLMLRFNFISDTNQTNKDGWIIDDFKISWEYMSGLEELSSSSIQLFPNPASDKISFKTLENIELKSVAIFDVLGNELYKKKLQNEQELKVDFLPAGVYFLEFECDKGKIKQRLVVE